MKVRIKTKEQMILEGVIPEGKERPFGWNSLGGMDALYGNTYNVLGIQPAESELYLIQDCRDTWAVEDAEIAEYIEE